MRIIAPKPPIALPPNLFFHLVQRSPGGTDPRTGNLIWNEESVLIKAYAFKWLKPKINEYPGVDQRALFLEGYTIDPKNLPDTLGFVGQVKAELKEQSGQTKKAGTFTFMPSTIGYAQDISAIGTYFCGYFLSTGS
jgi:hypothetical protein